MKLWSEPGSVVILIAAIAGSMACGRDRPQAAPDTISSPPAVDPGHVAVAGGQLYYEAAGTGPTVVLLHGGNLDRRMWDAEFAALSRSYRVVRYDARGYGRSSSADNIYAAHDDLAALLRSLGIGRASLVGLSLGGRIALDSTLAHPEAVECLVLAGPGISGGNWADDGDTLWIAAARAAHERGDSLALALAWLGSAYIRTALEDSAMARRVRQIVVENAPFWGSAIRHRDLERPANPPAAERLEQIRAPILLLVGSRDTPFIHDIANAIAARAPSVRRVDFPGIGHMINLESPDRFATEVTTFLERCPPNAGAPR